MKNFFLATIVILGCFLALDGIVFLSTGSDLMFYQFYAPKYEQARRQTFEQSRAFNEGMAQDLDQLRIEYTKAKTKDEKDVIKSTVLHRTAGYDMSNPSIAPEIRSFVSQLRNQ
jgi:hypothetical protein